MPISPQCGDLLYILVRATRPSSIIEFGMSYGVSTIYLASAVADNGTGHVVSTELSAAKVAGARANLAEARVADLPDKTLRRVGEALSRWTLTPNGTEGYRKSEVTRDGIDTRDLSSSTMMSLRAKISRN